MTRTQSILLMAPLFVAALFIGCEKPQAQAQPDPEPKHGTLGRLGASREIAVYDLPGVCLYAMRGYEGAAALAVISKADIPMGTGCQ